MMKMVFTPRKEWLQADVLATRISCIVDGEDPRLYGEDLDPKPAKYPARWVWKDTSKNTWALVINEDGICELRCRANFWDDDSWYFLEKVIKKFVC